MTSPAIRAFLEQPTNTVSYLVRDPATKEGAVIDPVLDWDPRSGTADTAFADRMLAAAQDDGVSIRRVLETHAHADHLTEAPYVKTKPGAPIGIGRRITEVQRISIQVNIRAGRFPEAEANGVRYFRIPVTAKNKEALS
jgi:glyoxylase-like metal-dependent hydrolase (beta-lactamase superfamily II)